MRVKRGQLNKGTAEIYLIRHGHSTANSKNILAGRTGSVHLSPQGKGEVAKLSSRLAGIEFAQLISSPLDRCLETLAPISASRSKLPIQVENLFIEMDYGSWSGKKLAILAKNKLWKQIQDEPSAVRFPDGESFNEMNTRVNEALLRAAKPGKRILICTHGDIIKAMIANIMGVHLDNFQRIGIDPASLSIIQIKVSGGRVLLLNDTSHSQSQKITSTGATLGGGSGS